MNTRDLLEQDQVWLTADRMPLLLVEMDPGHRYNTLAMLRRRAEYLSRAYMFCEERTMLIAPDGIYEQWLDERARQLADGPQAWLERRPLVARLAELVAEDQRGPVVDGEIVMYELPAGGGVLAELAATP